MNLGKESKVDNGEYNISVGFIDKYSQPNSHYIKINSWVKIKEGINPNDSFLRKIRREVKSVLNQESKLFNVIVDIDISKTRLSNGSRSFMDIIISYIHPDLPVTSINDSVSVGRKLSEHVINSLSSYFIIQKRVSRKGVSL